MRQLQVISFGFRYGPQPGWDLDPPEVLLDACGVPNPYRLPAYHDLSGMDEPVQEFVLAQPEAAALLIAAWGGAVAIARQRPDLQIVRVAIGCRGGKDRSVALAEECARRALVQSPFTDAIVRHLHWHLRGAASRHHAHTTPPHPARPSTLCR